MGGTAAGALLAVAVLCMATVAHGQGLTAAERQAAAEAAYDRGSDAFRGGDYSAAARWYETANELAPSANALVQAIRSHDRAGNDLRAGTLALDLVERYDDERVRGYAMPILERVAPTAVRVDVTCDDCELVIDGEAEDRRAFFLRPHTEHSVVARFETGTVEERVTGAPGTERDLSITAPEPEIETPGGGAGAGEGASGGAGSGSGAGPASGSGAGPGGGATGGASDGGGLSPAFVVVGAGLTLAAGGVLVWSGLDTLSARDDYEQEPTRAKLDDGRDLELRTNILIGVTAGLGAVTIVLAALTDWGGDGETTAAFAPLPGGGGLVTARGTFR